ncbi:MAG TPA: cytochrome c oxidase assembly protein [Stellaceae bacterium]|nr:cytochrome c oxidase assembly protein [Stellaceae bacterium]
MNAASKKPPGTQRKGLTAGALLGIVAAMSVLVAFSVPLYRLFCAATGYNGTTQRATEVASEIVKDRTITIRFDANVAPGLDWEFRPEQRSVQVHPGETKVIAYKAFNMSKQPVTGTATFNVTPSKAGLYFDKLQCFCFTAQHLAPGQSADLAVQFFVDPDIAKDHDEDDVDTITLSYTMFRAKDADKPVQSSALTANTNSIN